MTETPTAPTTSSTAVYEPASPSSPSPPPETPGSPSSPSSSTPRSTRLPSLERQLRPSSQPSVEYQDKIFVTGMTESGKSRCARELILAGVPPWVVIDPVGSEITKLPDSVTFSDPLNVPRSANIRFVPTDPADMDAYDAVYAEVHRRVKAREWSNARVWCDEAGQPLPVRGFPRRANALIVQGAKMSICHIACHTRPREILKGIITSAKHVVIYELPDEEDRRYLAGCIGVQFEVLNRLLLGLGFQESIWWEQATKTLWPLNRLPLKT